MTSTRAQQYVSFWSDGRRLNATAANIVGKERICSMFCNLTYSYSVTRVIPSSSCLDVHFACVIDNVLASIHNTGKSEIGYNIPSFYLYETITRFESLNCTKSQSPYTRHANGKCNRIQLRRTIQFQMWRDERGSPFSQNTHLKQDLKYAAKRPRWGHTCVQRFVD